MTNPDPETEKTLLRSSYRDVLREIAARETAASSSMVARGIAAWLQTKPGIRRLAIYAALPGEPDLALLHEWGAGLELHYPLVLPARRMSFHRVVDTTTLERSRYGILEPVPHRHPECLPEELDAFVCPGLAFDACGTRLGRGGGFYDRALAGVRTGIPRVGVCFEAQRAPVLPREPHDIIMTQLADEAGVRDVMPNPAGSS